jgi:hypothetical protein
MKKRILFLSDPHCGHRQGLTPPAWHQNSDHEKWWNRYVNSIEPLKPIHRLVLMGDMIDGEGKYHNGVDSLYTSFPDQLQIAQEVVEAVETQEKIIVVGGTEAHTGRGQNLERTLADLLNNTGKYRSVEFTEGADIVLGSYIINVQHFAPPSQNPYGSHTGPARVAVTDLLETLVWAREYFEERYGLESKDVKQFFHIRGHTHRYGLAETSIYFAMTLPSLQVSSQYGKKQFSSYTDWGIVYFDFDDEKVTWEKNIIRLNFRKDVIKW